MSKLSELTNIGRNLEKRLNSVGINDSESLRKIGSKEAFTRLKSKEFDTCINTLYALEGAIEGVRWHDLESDIKEELKNFFDKLNSN